jgi:hypothetical protein
MVVQVVRVRIQRQILFKSLDDCPADKRAATIRAVGVLIAQMSDDRSSTRLNVMAVAKELRTRDRTSHTSLGLPHNAADE